MNILHVITGLNRGGAETVLLRVISNDKDNKHFVISLSGAGDLQPLFATQTTVYLFDLKKGIRRFTKDLRSLDLPKIHLIQGWMYHGNIFASLLSIYFRCAHCWNIRHSNISLFGESFSTLLAFLLSIITSTIFNPYIIYCAVKPFEFHRKFYRSKKSFIIENGFDTRVEVEKHKFRQFDDCVQFVFVGRNVKQKNIQKILEALANLKTNIEQFHLHIYGAGFDDADFQDMINEYNLSDSVIIHGPESRKDKIYSNKHFLILCSDFGEGFPNVVLEAMAFGVPSIVSDCGDCFNIIGNSGFRVNENTPAGISQELLKAAQISSCRYAELRKSAQLRASQEFSVGKMLTKYNNTWKEVGNVE